MMRRLSKCFRRSEEGSLSVEIVIVVPLLVWAITATFVFWDAFKTLNVNQKATYTIADMISRETNAVDGNYLQGLHEVFDYLSNAPGDNAIRVSVVRMVEDPSTGAKTRELVWSQGVSGITGYSDLSVIEPRLPDMSDGEHLIVVESEQNWSPAFSVGLGTYRFYDVAISRPRFAPQIVWDANAGAPIGGSV